MGLEPSACIIQMFAVWLRLGKSLPLRARVEIKAILLPSGDHTGTEPTMAKPEVSLVRGMGLEPSAFITQMLLEKLILAASLPSRARCESKTILLPSGDQASERLLAFDAVSLVKG